MLKAPRPSGWAAGATESRSPVGAEPNLDPEVAPHAVDAFEEAHWAARLQARQTNALDSAPTRRDYQSAMKMHGPGCKSCEPTWCLHCAAHPTCARKSA